MTEQRDNPESGDTTSTETEDFSQDLKLIEEVRAEAERNPTPEMLVLLDALEMVMEEREQERASMFYQPNDRTGSR